MLDIKYIIAHTDYVCERLASRSINGKPTIEKLLVQDEMRKSLINEAETLKHRRNEISREVGCLKKEGKDTAALQEEVRSFAARIANIEKDTTAVEKEISSIMLNIPNLPDDSVPLGKSSEDNLVYRTSGIIPSFSFTPKPHWDLGEGLDFERGAKVSGARFTIIRGAAARLERALVNFMMDLHAENGYTELLPPQLINEASMRGTGQLPKFQEDMYFAERDNLYLSPTAEVPVTNMYSGEILPLTALPLNYAAYSACFRREAGSYGQDVRGLIRQHQFNKVELVKFAPPEKSMEALENMLNDACLVLDKLKMPYRVVTLCTGDMGFASAKTYDIEVWLSGQGAYREISSCSNCKDFQARRANIRYRDAAGKTAFLHTLNGSGLAVGRTMAAVIENCQQEDGSVFIPEVLRSYMKADIIKL